MSVFFINACKFNGCGKQFSTLQELIYHIEDTHLDIEPKNADETEFKQNNCMPISYIFRLFSGESIKPTSPNGNPTISSSRNSGSELDEENYESESEKSSIDSWSNNSIESETRAVLKIISTPKPVQLKSQDDSEKPYICQVADCEKRYRNSNGLKYHTKSVHTENGIKKEPAIPRLFQCSCNKNYKTFYGLKNHSKTCASYLANPVSKLSELKTTALVNNNEQTKFTTITSPSNTIDSTPIMTVSIANVTTSTNRPNDSTTLQPITKMEQDDQMENQNVTSTPNLQHILNPMETKSNHTFTTTTTTTTSQA